MQGEKNCHEDSLAVEQAAQEAVQAGNPGGFSLVWSKGDPALSLSGSCLARIMLCSHAELNWIAMVGY